MLLSDRLVQLGIQLPAPDQPAWIVSNGFISGNQLYVSGLAAFENGKPIVGMVGTDLSLDEAHHAARLTMLMILACIDQAAALDKIEGAAA